MDDLSLVTDTLTAFITAAIQASPIYTGPDAPPKPTVTAQHPETPAAAETQLNLYMFHIAADAHQANAFWSQAAQSGGRQPVAFEPLAIDLWYMLSAQSASSYHQEQQALGVAMQALHEHGTFALPGTSTPPPHSASPAEASLMLESPSFDEMSRLWEALNVSLRATAQYRVSVVFLDGRQPPLVQPPVAEANLAVAPNVPAPDPGAPHLVSTSRTVHYTAPGPAATSARAFLQSPASTAPAPAAVTGQEVVVVGSAVADTDRIVLVAHDAGGTTETDITAGWKVTPGGPSSRGAVLLRAPGGSPVPPGHYELTVRRPTAPGLRAAPVPLDVAAWVDAGSGPLLQAVGGRYSFGVRNVPAQGAELRLGAVRLTRVGDGGTPADGQWQHSADTITFRAPAGVPAGQHQIGLRVAGVESDPALWAVV
jgi:hypothetical protein